MQTADPNIKETPIDCPRCKTGKLENAATNFFLCSQCGDIYHKSTSLGLERLTVDSVNDLSSYPEVVVDPNPPFCDCRLRDYLETAFMSLGPSYCPKHNVISVGGMYEPKHIENIDKVAEYVIVHETLHWVLGKIFGEGASYWLDKDTVSKFLETCFLDHNEELK
jgi:hypothetical protein